MMVGSLNRASPYLVIGGCNGDDISVTLNGAIGTAHFFFAFFFVRDAYSLKWLSDVCEYSPTSIR